MFPAIRPKEDIKMVAKAIKALPHEARFGLLMYVMGLSDRHAMIQCKQTTIPDKQTQHKTHLSRPALQEKISCEKGTITKRRPK